MSFRQLINDRILVQETDEKYSGLIIIPKTAKKDRGIRRGVVLQMGPGILMADGTLWPMPECQVGDTVLFYFDSGVEVQLGNTKRLVIRSMDVVAVMEQEKEAAE